MAVKLISGAQKKFIGLSTDTKPVVSSVPIGSIFWESDTNIEYINNGTSWIKNVELIIH